ncbi:peptidoglycan DD-metalloendopeptidase family protein [Shewanella gelidii]|uniref:Subfamily M23B unassigned peptidase n=1 Tax=Shewanella gelidii TaxID=1642821 RepID=A0A917N7P6_9GAMM|nr:peptidoglycan DD-metalloendopeptidase family protein [Shewanella gelidii]MCL1097483.1 peptidoglycan DD-metalloendopeptidase family protein [Shewanella gelidii]GGI75580.1 subfamily M23B unassigned peptidase [Shewanella gelidii]
MIGAALLLPKDRQGIEVHSSPTQRIPIELDIASIVSKLPQPNDFRLTTPSADASFTVAKGDTLSELFMRAQIDQQTMYRVLEADLNILALDTLQPGNEIRFWLSNDGQLDKLELYFNLARQVVFSRYDDGSYRVDEVNVEGIWQNRHLSGQINGSFYLSAKRAGVTAGQIQQIEGLLKEKLNFARDLRAGDEFSILLSEQYVDGEASGQNQILGLNIQRGRKTISAYQHEDGNYYDEKGQSLARAFQRTPLQRRYRLTSHYNPKRKHPVTGRVAPHNGTDFATPVGTKIVAPGDGVVTLVTNHRYAGKYVVIQHGNKYKTRYLHLSKALVRKGQRVTRGQVIALSGKTGRITGAHLHYEFHINGRPVNPMKAKIPMAKQLPNKAMQRFSALVGKRKMIMGLS